MTSRERPPARSSVASTAGQAALGEYIDERVMAAILHTSLSAITALDGEGRIVFANPAAERVLRLEMAALSNERYDSPRWRLRHLDGRPLAPDEMPFRRIRDHGETVDDQRFEIEHANGDVRILEIRGVPLNDEAGQFRLAVFGLEDVTDQVATTEELRRTHELYRSAIQNADAMVYVLNFESGRYEVVSPGMAELLGCSPEACYQSAWKKLTLGWRVLDMPPECDGDQIREQFRSGRLDRVEYEIEVLDPNTRRRRWFRDCSMPIRVPGSTRVDKSVGLLIDVSRGREAEARLAETHELYRRAISNANAMLYVLDVATRRYEVASPEFAALLGRPAQSCGLDDWKAVVEEATLQNAPDGVETTNVWQHVLSGAMQRVEYECRVRDAATGRARWFRDVSLPLCNPDSGQVDRILGLLFDITEVREARDRLAEVHELYRSAIHNAGAMFYVFNLETLDYDMASPEFAAMLGKPGQACGYNDWLVAVASFKHIHPSVDGPDRNLLAEMRSGQLDRVEFEVTVRDARTDQVRCFRDYAMPIRGAAGEPVRRTLGLLVDITPLHVARTQLEAIHDIYRRAIQNADAMLYVLNFRTGRYEVATPEFQRLLGKPLEECTKADWSALVRQSHLVNAPSDVHLGNVNQLLATGQVERLEFEVQVADPETGTLRWFRDTSLVVREKGRPIERCLGLLIDVTRVHDAQAELQQVHEIYRRTITNANGIPYLLNHRSRMYDYFGPGIRVVLGDVAPPVPSEALNGRVLNRHLVEAPAPLGQAPTPDGEMARLTAEVEVACHDGQTRWFLDTSLPVRDPTSGEVTGSVGILQDITEGVRERRIDDVLGRMTTRLSGARSPREAALSVLEAADELIDWDMGFLLTYDAVRKMATAQVVLDRAEGGKREFQDPNHTMGPPGAGAQRAIDHGAYIISGDELARDRLALQPMGDQGRRSQSLMFVPLMADRVCTGVLSLQSYRPDAFDATRLALAKRLASLCAAAVARIEAEEAARLAQAQLSTAHEIYRRAILNANGIPYLLNFTTQEYEYAGPNIERLLGPVQLPIARAQLLERVIEVRVVDPPGMSIHQLRAEIENRRLQRYIAEVRLRCHDGVLRWFVDTALPLADPATGANTRSLGILQDITERVHEKEVDIAMAQMGSRLGAATTPLDVARIVVETADKLLGWDSTFVTLHDSESGDRESLLIIDTIDGVRTELPSEPFLSLTPGPAYTRCLDEGGFVLNYSPDFDEGPERLTRFGDVSRPSASLLFVALVDQGRPVGVLSIQSYTPNAYNEAALGLLRRLAVLCSAAITRTLTSQRLRETESQLTALAETAPGVMFQFLVAPDGSRRLTYISPAVEELWGQPPAAFHYHPMRVLEPVHPEDSAAVLEQLEHSIATQQAFSANFRLRHPSGDIRWIRAQARPSPVRKDGMQPWSGLMSDITPLRDAEDKRRRLDEEMQNLDKLESLGLLAGGVAHDFNNLLSGVVANAALALADVADNHPAREPLRQIEAAAQRMSELAHQMLAYSGRGRFVNKVFELGQLAGETIRLVRSSIPPAIQIHMDTAAEPMWAEGDPSQIRQIILNLVTNAREAIGDNRGTITVSTERRVLAAEDLPRVPWRDEMRPGAYVSLSIEDTGHGMDDETMRRIFEPFFSTKFAGRGLGLAASQGILRAHGGAIAVRSAVGQGSIFTIRLPEAPRPAPPAKPARPRSARPAPIDASVLVVDDEAPVRQVIETILRREGVRVTLCADGASALAHLANPANTVDAVLLDVTMPGMSGAEFYQKARATHPRLPIIVMSGYAEAEVGTVFGQATLSGFLSKPFKPADVMAMLTRALAATQQDTRS